MQHIADWLQNLGLSQYAQRFAENDINFAILSDLTDQDFKELGVASLGHRRLLLRAIVELKTAEKGTLTATVTPAAPTVSPKTDAAERRQVTVMFSDLVGSTALSARMDPEDLREVITAYQKCVAETMSRFDGFVAKYMGDGALVYFGYPQAYEDDAERAVRAGLELVAAIGALKTHARLQTRVGIATGLVVVGDLIGSGEAQERGIVGETPNLAARLQAIAEPNMVVIAEATRRLLGSLFELRDLGPKDLKGLTGPVRAWAALRPSTVESRFEALRASGMTALVGRKQETELLLRRWSKAKTGEGQVVLLSGEAGIGKSRLTAALLERLATERHTRLRYFCSPQHRDSAFYPIIGQMEGAARQTLAGIPISVPAVPASLHASLMARLDRLGTAKEVAQVGAGIGREFSHDLLTAVAGKPRPLLEAAIDRLVEAGLLFRQGKSPHVSYVFKHALVQDAAYGTLLREPRRALHARIADTLESQFADIVETQPELVARHCTEAGLIEKAAGLWGKAGQRSLARSALVEAIEQLTRSLTQIASLPGSPAMRREQLKLQVTVITPLLHIKGYAAPETKAAAERARVLIEQAEALGEPPDDPLLLFSTLYGLWTANYVASNTEVMRDLAENFLRLAQKQQTIFPLVAAHRIMGSTWASAGFFAEARTHYDQGLALYHRDDHRQQAMRFGVDLAVSILSHRSRALWFLGYPESALADAERALREAREIGHAGTLMYALQFTSSTYIYCGCYSSAMPLVDEVLALADKKSAKQWKSFGMLLQGWLFASIGKSSEAVPIITSAIAAWRLLGAEVFVPMFLSQLANAYAILGHFNEARRCIGDAITAIESNKETCWEPDINRIAGEIALKSPEHDEAKAQIYFERALVVARQQQAKSWELRAATSMARLWHDQGKVQQARELLAPVYGRFTEGFDTRDLRDAKALLEELGT
jgi:class 3 adenylate cyclase/predicted ATPase